MEGLTTADSIGVAVAGYGYWGANLARNVVAAMSTRLVVQSWRFDVDVICTRNPAGVVAAYLIPGVIGVFDTDDGPAGGLNYSLAVPFATVVTAPEAVGDAIDARRLSTYRGFKASAYLHPNRFRPNRSVRESLDVTGQPYAIVGFVSMRAVHDVGEFGIPAQERERLVAQLSTVMPVFVSSEDVGDTYGHPFTLDPVLFHDALGLARLYVGDSQSVAIEACLLGTPAIHCSSWSGRLANLQGLISEGLLESFQPGVDVDIAQRSLRPPSALLPMK